MIAERDLVEMRDIDGHKFLIPVTEVSHFEKLINKINDAAMFTDEYQDACQAFWDRFNNYSA